MIEWEGKTYKSVMEAARANGMAYQNMYYRVIVRGYTSEAEMPMITSPKKTRWNGKTYKSITEAARHAYISRRGMQYRRQRGYTSDKDIYNWSKIHDSRTNSK